MPVCLHVACGGDQCHPGLRPYTPSAAPSGCSIRGVPGGRQQRERSPQWEPVTCARPPVGPTFSRVVTTLLVCSRGPSRGSAPEVWWCRSWRLVAMSTARSGCCHCNRGHWEQRLRLSCRHPRNLQYATAAPGRQGGRTSLVNTAANGFCGKVLPQRPGGMAGQY